jgi:hypothetical protein
LAVGDSKGVSFWEIAAGNERCRIEIPSDGSTEMMFSTDGRWLAHFGDRNVNVYDILRSERVHSFVGHEGHVYCVAFTPDNRRLISGSFDTTALVWDLERILAKRAKPTVPDTDSLDAARKELANSDAKAAFQALSLLVDGGDKTVALLRERLRPSEAVDAKRLENLLRDLGSDRFSDRERATKELANLDERAEPALRRFMSENPSQEARRRAESLLSRLNMPINHPDRLQRLRSLEVLEYIGNPQARQLLGVLAQGADDVEQSREAKNTLRRLSKRDPPK